MSTMISLENLKRFASNLKNGAFCVKKAKVAESVDWTKAGMVPLDKIPAGALERLVHVTNKAARLALTSQLIQLGDTVQQDDTKEMFIVVDETKLGTEDAFVEYTAGNAKFAEMCREADEARHAEFADEANSAYGFNAYQFSRVEDVQPSYIDWLGIYTASDAAEIVYERTLHVFLAVSGQRYCPRWESSHMSDWNHYNTPIDGNRYKAHVDKIYACDNAIVINQHVLVQKNDTSIVPGVFVVSLESPTVEYSTVLGDGEKVWLANGGYMLGKRINACFVVKVEDRYFYNFANKEGWCSDGNKPLLDKIYLRSWPTLDGSVDIRKTYWNGTTFVDFDEFATEEDIDNLFD